MRSRTSFFNQTLFLKSVARFWPVWGAYLVIWILIMPTTILAGSRYGRIDALYEQNGVLQFAKFGGVIMGGIFAILAAMAVWSFLYNARSAHGMACLPVRREGQFMSAMLAGIAPLLAANAVVAVLTLLAGAAVGWADPFYLLQWFAIVSLILLFFYGFATLCAQLTGNIIILPLVYAVLNFLVIGVEELLRGVFSQFVYGMAHEYGITTRWFSPAIGYLTGLDISAVYDPAWMPQNRYIVIGYRFLGWGVVLGYALIGIAMLFGALLLFRRRRMETAGDVVAVQVLKPVYRWCMALGCGLVLASLMYFILFTYNDVSQARAFLTLLAFLLVGAFVGWFAAEMLMKKSFRVFSAKCWAGCGLCGFVIVALMLGMRLDLFGFEKRVPEADDIESVIVSSGGNKAVVMGEEGIALARELHRRIIADKDWNSRYYKLYELGWLPGMDWITCTLNYQMDNGSTVLRRYALVYDEDDPSRGDIAPLNAVMNCQEAIAARKATAFPITRDNIYSGTVSASMSAVECAKAAGYDAPEDYVLSVWGRGYPAGRGEMGEAYYAMLGETVLNRSENGYALYDRMNSGAGSVPATSGDIYAYDDYAYTTVVPAATARPGYDADYDLAQFARELEWNEVYFEYTWVLDPAEAWDLYRNCVQPDLDDGTLGRVWVVSDDDFYHTVYAARIEIEARVAEPAAIRSSDFEFYARPVTGGEYSYARFYTIPAADSVRTDLWLRQYGVTLHTEAEVHHTELLG